MSTAKIERERVGSVGISFLKRSVRFLTFLLYQTTAAIGIAYVVGQAIAQGQMIHHLTEGIAATYTGAGITALFVHAGTIAAAVRVASAFGTANLIGIAVVVGQALTDTESALRQANGICATGIGLTWQRIGHRLGRLYACITSITYKIRRTVAERTMHDGTAQGSLTTAAWTGIHAFAVHTGLVGRTVGAAHTLRSTVRWCAYVISETCAACTTLWSSHTFGVRATGRGFAGIHFDGISYWKN